MLTSQISEVQEKEVKINSIFTLPGMGCVPWKEEAVSLALTSELDTPSRVRPLGKAETLGNHRYTVPVTGALTKMGLNFVKAGVGIVA